MPTKNTDYMLGVEPPQHYAVIYILGDLILPSLHVASQQARKYIDILH